MKASKEVRVWVVRAFFGSFITGIEYGRVKDFSIWAYIGSNKAHGIKNGQRKCYRLVEVKSKKGGVK